MSVAIIILNWRNAKDTLGCVESLLALRSSDYKIFVCDNLSSDGSEEDFMLWASNHKNVSSQRFVSLGCTGEELRSECSNRIVWVQTGENLGFAGGNNIGVKLALSVGDFDYFWLLNNDCVVDADALTCLSDYMRVRPDVGICGAKLVYFYSQDKVQAYAGARHHKWTGRARYIGHLAHPGDEHNQADVEANMSYVAGASMFIRRAFIEQIGLMHEDYFLYFEEIDWALRGARTFRLGYEPRAVVYHKEGGTIGSSSDTRRTSRISDFYLFRNRLRFTRRFYPEALPSVWFVMLLQAVRRGMRGQTDRMWLIFQILFGKQRL